MAADRGWTYAQKKMKPTLKELHLGTARTEAEVEVVRAARAMIEEVTREEAHLVSFDRFEGTPHLMFARGQRHPNGHRVWVCYLLTEGTLVRAELAVVGFPLPRPQEVLQRALSQEAPVAARHVQRFDVRCGSRGQLELEVVGGDVRVAAVLSLDWPTQDQGSDRLDRSP
ncbi:MAG: hypothetical protein AB1758_18975 [Candidatus Eremiobacterota bacterium]